MGLSSKFDDPRPFVMTDAKIPVPTELGLTLLMCTERDTFLAIDAPLAMSDAFTL
jgi:hypothetical protein